MKYSIPFLKILFLCLSFFFIQSCIQKVFASDNPLTIQDYERNRVVVRVWHFKEGKLGHVSIQLPHQHNNYISFWPCEGGSNKEKIKNLVPGEFYGLGDDYLEEERSPETIVSLYTLNADKIREKILDFQQKVDTDENGKTTGWRLFGGSFFIWDGSLQHNCASLVLSLLKHGDIEKLFLQSIIPEKCKLTYAFETPSEKIVKINPHLVIRPDNVADIVLKARKCEREKIGLISKIPIYKNEIDFSSYKERDLSFLGESIDVSFKYHELETDLDSVSNCLIM